MAHQLAQAEYDLDTFAPRVQRQRQPLKVVKNPKSKKYKAGAKRINFSFLKMMATLVLVLGLVVALLVSQTTVTEITDQLQQVSQDLMELESENAYLNSQLGMQANTIKVEEYAQNQLGLAKVERGQISYIAKDNQESITRKKSGLEQLGDHVFSFFEKIGAYFTA